MPHVNPVGTICMVAQDLIAALNNPHPRAPIDLEPIHNKALWYLSNIFYIAVNRVQPTSKGDDNVVLRVVELLSSHNTAAPKMVRLQPCIHQQVTQ